MHFLTIFLTNTFSLFLVSYLMQSIRFSSFSAALITVIALSAVNALIRPFLLFLTLPITLVTLGAFVFIINGFIFWVTSHIVNGFYVQSFWSAVGGFGLQVLFKLPSKGPQLR